MALVNLISSIGLIFNENEEAGTKILVVTISGNQMWNEMEANNDPIPVEGFNAYLVTITTDDVNKLKVIIFEPRPKIPRVPVQF